MLEKHIAKVRNQPHFVFKNMRNQDYIENKTTIHKTIIYSRIVYATTKFMLRV